MNTFKKYKKDKAINVKKEGEYILYYYFVKGGKTSSLRSTKLIIDNTFPSYNILLNNVIQKKAKDIIVPKGADIVIDAKDGGSGVKEILYAYEDKNIYHLYKGYISVSGKKPFYIYFKLIDNVGNATPIYSTRIIPYHPKR
jgi:hypothetical protein